VCVFNRPEIVPKFVVYEEEKNKKSKSFYIADGKCIKDKKD